MDQKYCPQVSSVLLDYCLFFWFIVYNHPNIDSKGGSANPLRLPRHDEYHHRLLRNLIGFTVFSRGAAPKSNLDNLKPAIYVSQYKALPSCTLNPCLYVDLAHLGSWTLAWSLKDSLLLPFLKSFPSYCCLWTHSSCRRTCILGMFSSRTKYIPSSNSANCIIMWCQVVTLLKWH